MSTSCACAVADCGACYERFGNSDRFQIRNNVGTAVKFAHIYPCVVDTAGILRHNNRTGSDRRTVGAFPIRAVGSLDICLFHANLRGYAIVGDRTAVADSQPVSSINGHRVIPRKTACRIAELCERVVHKSRTVDTKVVDRLYRQRSVLSLIVCVPIALIAKGIRRAEKSCSFCYNRIR